MLLNRFNASGVGRRKPKLRYVGQYECDFSASNTTNITLPIADLRTSPGDRQLLVFVGCEQQLDLSMTIAGVTAARPCQEGTGFLTVYTAYNNSTSDITITVVQAGSNSENGRVAIYEVADADDLRECLRFVKAGTGAASVLNMVIPPDGVSVACDWNTTDSVTYTWTNLTEDGDADGGDYRISSASNPTPVGAKTRNTVTATASAGTSRGLGLSIAPVGKSVKQVTGGLRLRATANAVLAASVTFSGQPAALNLAQEGSFKYVCAIWLDADTTISSVTVGGQALTRIGQARNTAASPDMTVEFWAIDVVNGSPTGNVVVNFAGAISTTLLLETYQFYGVGSVGTPQSVTGNATGAALAVTVEENGFILAATIRQTEAQTTTWTGVEEHGDAAFSSLAASSAQRPLCDREINRTVQAVGSASGQYATLAIAFNP